MSENEKPLPPFESDLTPAEVDEQFARLEQSMSLLEEKTQKDLTALAQMSEPEFDPAQELAAQIAEDDALKAQEAAEAAQPALDPEFQAALPTVDAQGNLDQAELESCLEALLFMLDKPVSLKKLNELLGEQFAREACETALAAIQTRYENTHHGFELVSVAGGYQFRTKLGRAALARKLAKIQVQRLSRGAMETLTLIAYKQPCLKEEIDQIRGVDSSHFVRGLLDRGVIEISARSELPGRPMLYKTTDQFLQLFTLDSLADLPPLQEIEAMIPSSENLSGEEEDPKVRQMRKLVSQMSADPTRLQYDSKQDDEFLSEIRERVKGISTTTPYIESLKAPKEEAVESKPAKIQENLL